MSEGNKNTAHAQAPVCKANGSRDVLGRNAGSIRTTPCAGVHTADGGGCLTACHRADAGRYLGDVRACSARVHAIVPMRSAAAGGRGTAQATRIGSDKIGSDRTIPPGDVHLLVVRAVACGPAAKCHRICSCHATFSLYALCCGYSGSVLAIQSARAEHCFCASTYGFPADGESSAMPAPLKWWSHAAGAHVIAYL